jgi:hypothetical protein
MSNHKKNIAFYFSELWSHAIVAILTALFLIVLAGVTYLWSLVLPKSQLLKRALETIEIISIIWMVAIYVSLCIITFFKIIKRFSGDDKNNE